MLRKVINLPLLSPRATFNKEALTVHYLHLLRLFFCKIELTEQLNYEHRSRRDPGQQGAAEPGIRCLPGPVLWGAG